MFPDQAKLSLALAVWIEVYLCRQFASMVHFLRSLWPMYIKLICLAYMRTNLKCTQYSRTHKTTSYVYLSSFPYHWFVGLRLNHLCQRTNARSFTFIKKHSSLSYRLRTSPAVTAHTASEDLVSRLVKTHLYFDKNRYRTEMWKIIFLVM